MAYLNGRLPDSALRSIPGGRLEISAAAAWNAMNEALGGILRPLGNASSYRLYAIQVYFWNLYLSGRGNLAARPGTSNHGWGKAVDLAALFMRHAIDRAGRAFGWAKVEAPSEWWHVNYVGGFKPRPDPLVKLGKRREAACRLLLYRRRQRIEERETGIGAKWRKWDRAVNRSYRKVHKLWKRAEPGPQKRLMKRVLDDRNGRI
jgi:hypothetical protein